MHDMRNDCSLNSLTLPGAPHAANWFRIIWERQLCPWQVSWECGCGSRCGTRFIYQTICRCGQMKQKTLRPCAGMPETNNGTENHWAADGFIRSTRALQAQWWHSVASRPAGIPTGARRRLQRAHRAIRFLRTQAMRSSARRRPCTPLLAVVREPLSVLSVGTGGSRV